MSQLHERFRRLWGNVSLGRKLRVVSGVLIVLLLGAICMEVIWMVNGVQGHIVLAGGGALGCSDNSFRQADVKAMLNGIQKRRLFMPAIPLPVRSMARESVNRVRGMLSLHGITKMNGERMAYINVEGMGMKPFKAGDQVEDLFKVTSIEEQVVEVEIAGERVELGL